jgi:hypothetical protein
MAMERHKINDGLIKVNPKCPQVTTVEMFHGLILATFNSQVVCVLSASPRSKRGWCSGHPKEPELNTGPPEAHPDASACMSPESLLLKTVV